MGGTAPPGPPTLATFAALAVSQLEPERPDAYDTPQHLPAEVAELRRTVWAAYSCCATCWRARRHIAAKELFDVYCQVQYRLRGGGNAAAALGAAANQGRLECMKWALENGALWQSTAPYRGHETTAAAGSGNLECLRYAHEHGCEWQRGRATWEAARYGQLACLQYAHEHGAPWNPETTSIAAEHGHLACLKYAHENGCAWNSRTTDLAIRRRPKDELLIGYCRRHDPDSPLFGQYLLSGLQVAHEPCPGCPTRSPEPSPPPPPPAPLPAPQRRPRTPPPQPPLRTVRTPLWEFQQRPQPRRREGPSPRIARNAWVSRTTFGDRAGAVRQPHH